MNKKIFISVFFLFMDIVPYAQLFDGKIAKDISETLKIVKEAEKVAAKKVVVLENTAEKLTKYANKIANAANVIGSTGRIYFKIKNVIQKGEITINIVKDFQRKIKESNLPLFEQKSFLDQQATATAIAELLLREVANNLARISFAMQTTSRSGNENAIMNFYGFIQQTNESLEKVEQKLDLIIVFFRRYNDILFYTSSFYNQAMSSNILKQTDFGRYKDRTGGDNIKLKKIE